MSAGVRSDWLSSVWFGSLAQPLGHTPPPSVSPFVSLSLTPSPSLCLSFFRIAPYIPLFLSPSPTPPPSLFLSITPTHSFPCPLCHSPFTTFTPSPSPRPLCRRHFTSSSLCLSTSVSLTLPPFLLLSVCLCISHPTLGLRDYGKNHNHNFLAQY